MWDTGSQVTIINDSWRESCFPHIQLRSLDELLSKDEILVGKAANQTDIPFAGWVEIKFRLGSTPSPQPELLVPVLVSSEPGIAEPPIIGYNVIEYLVRLSVEAEDFQPQAADSRSRARCDIWRSRGAELQAGAIIR